MEYLFYHSNPLIVSLILLGVLIASYEIGLLIIKRRTIVDAALIENPAIPLIITGVVTLLPLMLGFTYTMSENRFETRRQLVIDEANAIGTTYLRAKTLPEPTSSVIREALRQYTGLRVDILNYDDVTPQVISKYDMKSKQLQTLIWTRATALAKAQPSPITSLFLTSLNTMIDLHTARLAAYRNQVPFTIYLVLFIASDITLWMFGFCFKSSGKGMGLPAYLFALLIASVLWLTIDLDQPTRGRIRVSQQSLVDLYRDLNAQAHETVGTHE